jgi:hypothetical protein
VKSSANDQLLRAGAVLLTETDTAHHSSKAVAQEVRSYTHRLLGSRVVAKITAVDVGAASDATMEFLGFNEPATSGPIGMALHTALGFPESALIADPKNARYALGVVKDLNRFARMARGRAGAAKEGMEALGVTLAKSVPQFLPSFFEQCGRIFVANENITYGGAMFVKARTAEATFGLAVDEEQRRSAFLEFAFAGALPAKALDEYAKSLSAAYPPAEAFAHFHSLALQRTRGGLAPWAQLMDVLKRMAKAASVDVESAQREMLSALFGSPSLRFASLTFWKSIRTLTVAMAKDDSAIRGGLLNLHPRGDFAEWWMELLNDCSATQALFEKDANTVEAERAIGGRGAWLNRFLDDHGTKPAGTEDLIRKMAPQLVAEVASIQFHHWRVNVDCIDVALELGVTCAPTDSGWYTYSFDEAQRPLTFLAAAPQLRRTVEKSVRSEIEDKNARRVFDREGLRPFLIEWLEQRVEALSPRTNKTGRGTFDFVEAVGELVESATPAMLDLVPDAHQRLAAADGVGALQRQLRAGLFEEYTWPALESALSTLESGRTKKSGKIEIHEAWPNAIVHDGRRAIVVDHHGTVLEHDLQWKADTWQKRLLFVDGALYVSWSDWSTKPQGYWTNDIRNVIENESMVFTYYPSSYPSLPLADGGRTNGARGFKVGDVVVPEPHQVLSDGRNYWVLEGMHLADGWRAVCSEFDPATGIRGRKSYPRFIEDQLSASVKAHSMELLPAFDNMTSPMGMKDGLVGWVRLDPAQEPVDDMRLTPASYELVRVDGVRIRVMDATDYHPTALIDWPGASEHYFTTNEGVVCTPTTRTTISESAQWFGHSVEIPLMYWHHFTIRDAKGSKALRAVTPKHADAIFAKAAELVARATPVAPFDPEVDQPELTKTVSKILADVHAPLLTSAVARAAGVVALAAQQLAAWLTGATVASATAFTPADEKAEELMTGAACALLHESYSMRFRTQLRALKSFTQMAPGSVIGELDYDIERALTGDGASPEILMDGAPALAYRALLDTTPDDVRQAILAYLDEWLDHPISQHDSLTFGKYRVECEEDPEGKLFWDEVGTPWWISASEMDPDNDDSDDLYEVNAVAFRAKAAPPNGYTEVKTWSVKPYVETERVRDLVTMIRELGPLPAMTAEAASRFADRTGCSRALAAVVLTGFRGIGYHSIDLTKEERDRFGVKAADVKAAVSNLENESLTKRQKMLISACYPEELDRLWTVTAEEFAGHLADAWASEYGTQTVIDDDLLAALTKLLSDSYRSPNPRELLCDLDGSVPQYAEDLPVTFDDDGDISHQTDAMRDNWVEATIRTMAMLAHDRPIGDPWRAHVARGVVSLLQKLDHASLVIPWSETELPNKALKELATDLTVVSTSDKLRVYDAGDMIVVNANSWNDKPIVWKFYLRPNKFDEPSLTRGLADSFVETSFACPTLLGWLYSVRSLGFLQGLLESPVPEGGYDQNPSGSVPALVKTVAAELAVTDDVAAFYMQLLVLSEPTTANIRKWNEWTAKQVTAASAVLVEKGLLLSAKRAGSGRDVFLPGAWVEMQSPAIGLEDWKVPMYALAPQEGTKRASYLGRVLPLDSIPTLFTQAWERWMSGDRPGFVAAGPGLGERKKKAK